MKKQDGSLTRTDLFERVDAEDALRLLKDGNRRYCTNNPCARGCEPDVRRLLAQKGQSPFAAILSCSDSRVPPEIVFDAGLGQLFVVRTAGNTADDIVIGSIEYAAEHLRTPLVVVLGHEKCGAVAAAVSGGQVSPCIGAIISEIQPSLQKVLEHSSEEAASRCEDENILYTAEKLRGNPVLSELIREGALDIVAAKYDIHTGEVRFFAGITETRSAV